mmetsp:Transcript_21787/g.50270  ORF Transcript_21787/g.50270 Transcript_21787/m.50270 type:complete len:158 (-) Transcript_21787:142-615(-)
MSRGHPCMDHSELTMRDLVDEDNPEPLVVAGPDLAEAPSGVDDAIFDVSLPIEDESERGYHEVSEASSGGDQMDLSAGDMDPDLHDDFIKELDDFHDEVKMGELTREGQKDGMGQPFIYHLCCCVRTYSLLYCEMFQRRHRPSTCWQIPRFLRWRLG